MVSSGLGSLLWFIVIVAMIPVALWLLKRTPMGGAGAQGVMRSVAVLPLSPSQRVVTVEVGQGDDRRWLVLGITPQNITTLHTMAPQMDLPPADAMPLPPMAASFAQMLAKLRRNESGSGKEGASS
jgi:flagellar protein FliO/FliZ